MTRDLALVQRALGDEGPLNDPKLLEAVATICLLMAAADGEVSPAERKRIPELLLQLTGGTDVAPVQTVLGAAAKRIEGRERESILEHLAATVINPGMRRRMLAYAAAVAWADKRLHDPEALLLGEIAGYFDIGAIETEQLVQRLKEW
jgi:tellurite resistance protein